MKKLGKISQILTEIDLKMNQHHCEGKGACFYFKKYEKMSSKNCKKLCFADWLMENPTDIGACPVLNSNKLIDQYTKAFNLKK